MRTINPFLSFLLLAQSAGAVVTRGQIFSEINESGESFDESLSGSLQDGIALKDWQEDLSGYWTGKLCDSDGCDTDEDGLHLLLRFTVKHENVLLYSLDQGGSLIPATNAMYSRDLDLVSLGFNSINGRFMATLKGDKLTGSWTQAGRAFPLSFNRYRSSMKTVPQSFRFLLDKIVTDDSKQLGAIAGFWSGTYAEQTVIVQLEQVSEVDDTAVEPKLYVPDATPFPVGIRSLFMGRDSDDQATTIKLVVDDPLSGITNGIFQGKQTEEGKIVGVVLTDIDDPEPLVLTWSKTWPGEETL